MSDEVNQRLVTMIDSIGEVVKRADGFASEQLPLVVNEIIRWEIASGIFGIVSALLLIVLGWLAARWCWKEGESRQSNLSDGALLCSLVVCVISFIIGAIILLPASMQTAKALTAPRLVVLDYVSKMK